MMKTYSNMDELVRRLERVENQHRRMKSLSGVLGFLLLAIVLMGAQAAMQDGQFRKITAHEVTIVDSMGKPRVQIGTLDEGTGIRILNAEGKRIVGLGLPVDEEGSGLLVADSEGIPRIGLGMDQGIPSIAMTNDAGKKVIALGGNASGYGLVVMSADEVERIGIGLDGQGNSGIVLYDNQGQYVRGMVREKNGVHFTSHIDENGKEVVHR